ncbi:hypothetical protein [Paractinoplanes rishiriensis]|uniref:DUF2637 domain-containing protein n=1 Tax=Paractinoplanes rishiriensis TaxID=1050105 RepID=A0A919N1U2_9ACTN|nr:hypothetical protein [Actinoplanes rishiriensis]GIF02351.1 hypothetical protein Ari01nite_98150 [Actinoplanes rishiriensis]
MTTTTATRSAYPPAVEALIPRARALAATLDRPLSRNILMKQFRIGSPKATAVMEALTADTAVPDATEQEAPPAGRGVLELVPPPVSAPPAEAPATDAGPVVDAAPATAPRAEVEPPPPAPPVAHAAARRASQVTRYGMAALLSLVGVLLAGVIVAPIALSSQDIIAWAGSPFGLGLSGPWPLVTFFALDAAAAVCVGLVVYCAWRGESAGVFAWLVWAFAGMSAYANYSHSTGSIAKDAVWFFPAMSLAGPFLLEIIVRRVRRWVQEGTGQRARHSVSFGAARWIPGVGALRETYGAWRLARLDGITDARHAVTAYRRLCPDGSIRILRALRNRDRKS